MLVGTWLGVGLGRKLGVTNLVVHQDVSLALAVSHDTAWEADFVPVVRVKADGAGRILWDLVSGSYSLLGGIVHVKTVSPFFGAFQHDGSVRIPSLKGEGGFRGAKRVVCQAIVTCLMSACF